MRLLFLEQNFKTTDEKENKNLQNFCSFIFFVAFPTLAILFLVQTQNKTLKKDLKNFTFIKKSFMVEFYIFVSFFHTQGG